MQLVDTCIECSDSLVRMYFCAQAFLNCLQRFPRLHQMAAAGRAEQGDIDKDITGRKRFCQALLPCPVFLSRETTENNMQV